MKIPIPAFLQEMQNTKKKDKIAKMLRMNPREFQRFEEAYQKSSLYQVSDNFFEVNAKQASEQQNHLVSVDDESILSDIIHRIVDELLEQTQWFSYQNGVYTQGHTAITAGKRNGQKVSLQEIMQLPEQLRPQLTGEFMKVDIEEPSCVSILDSYDRYRKHPHTKMGMTYYNLFRQGLDILDLDMITYQILGMNQNAIGFWFPALVEACKQQNFFKLPNTTVIKVPLPMLQLTRCEYSKLTPTTLKIVDDFCQKAFQLDIGKEYFVKTGTFSSKYDFRNAHIKGEKEVRELGEYLLYIHFQANQMASPLSKPTIYGVSTTNEWVVRDYIQDKEANPCIYKGMPLHTEYRIFVDFDAKEIIGKNPYWDPDVMKKRFGHEQDADSPHQIHDYIVYSMHEPVLMQRYKENIDTVCNHIRNLIPYISLHGQWSIDVMQNGNDFWIIDMALAQNSALLQCVPKALQKPSEENWIPKLGNGLDKKAIR